MLTLGQSLINKSVLSLRTSTAIGRVTGILIDPNNLKIEGWYALDTQQKQKVILLAKEVRDIIGQGFVVDDVDALSNQEDLVRLKPIMEINFELIDKQVLSQGGQKLGKVTDYAFDKDALFIQKLYVSQSMLKSLSGGTLVIDRTQIIEVTNKKIVVAEATVTDQSPVPAAIPAN